MSPKTMPRWSVVGLWTAVVLLALTGVVAVTGRILDLVEVRRTGLFPGPDSFDAPFARHPRLTLVHVILSLLFMLLGPLQFVRGIRTRWLRLHRWSGRIYLVASMLIAYSALRLVFLRSFGGPSETAATVLFTGIFGFSLGKAYLHVRRREVARHREWMIRGFAIGLAIATIRPVVGLYSALGDLSVQESLGTAFWISFTLHLIAAEVWINLTRG